MKTKLLLLCIFCSAYTHAQLRLIKQTEDNVYRRGVTGLKTLNNDIIFAMTESGSPYKIGAYISNGSSDTTNEIQGLENNTYSFEGLFKENYVINNDVFLFSSRLLNYQSEDKAYKINDARTSAKLVASSPSNQTITRTSNNKIIKQQREYYAPYTLYGNRYSGGYNFNLDIYNANGLLENSISFNGNTGVNSAIEDFNSLTLITNIFYWKGTYYFTGNNTQNRTDLYKIGNNRPYRITELFVTGTSNISVEPSDIVLGNSYIYFQGLYRTWGVNDDPNDYVDEGRELCYTNGSTTFGSGQTQIPLFIFNYSKENYDGTRGFRAKETTENYANSKPITELNGSIVFIDENTSYVNAINTNGTVDNLILYSNTSDEYFVYDNKLYYLVYEYHPDYSNTSYLYEIDGDPLNTIKHELPLSNNGDKFSLALKNKFALSKKDGKVYILGAYHPAEGVKAGILSFDFETSQFTKEVIFDYDEISGSITNIHRFNNGFVFSDFDKVYSYNVDIRAKYIKPNESNKSAQSTKTNSESDITYNNNTYFVDVESSNLTTDETLRIELLDTTSTAFKSKIGSLPDKSFAQTYYKIVTLNESNHQSTLTLTYNNQDFKDNITSTSNLSAQIFKDGNWTNIAIESVDLSAKTFTITHNFEPSTLIFLKNNATLSISKFTTNNLIIHPNPTSSVLNIQLKDEATITETTVYNMVGKQVLKNNTNSKTLDISKLSQGMYILKVKSSRGSFFKNIIKE